MIDVDTRAVEEASAQFKAACEKTAADLAPIAARVKAASVAAVESALDLARTGRTSRSGHFPAVKPSEEKRPAPTVGTVTPAPSPAPALAPAPKPAPSDLTGRFSKFK